MGSNLRQLQRKNLMNYAVQLSLPATASILDIGIGGDQLEPSENYPIFTTDNFHTMDIDANVGATFTADICDSGLPDNVYDLVLLCQTLEHIWDYQSAIAECHRICKIGGHCIIDTPWQYEYHESIGSYDYWRFSHVALRRLCEEAGFECLDSKIIGGVLSTILCRKSKRS